MATATRTAPRTQSVKATPAPVDVATVQTAVDHAVNLDALANPATPVVQPDAHCQDWAAQLQAPTVPTAPACNLADGFYPPVAPPTPQDMLAALLDAPTTAKPRRSAGAADKVKVPYLSSKLSDVASQLLAVMRPGVVYTSRDLVLTLGRIPGQTQGQPVVDCLNDMARRGQVTVVRQGGKRSPYLWALATVAAQQSA